MSAAIGAHPTLARFDTCRMPPMPPSSTTPLDALGRPVLDDATRRWLPWVVALAFFMQTLDTTILNTALPGME